MNHILAYIRDSLDDFFENEELKNLSVIICRDILGLSMMDFYLRKDMKLSEKQKMDLERTVARLKKHEPIQYICGATHFFGLELYVKPGVLIPRPETEELVELILKENPAAGALLDVGTGSGCIAIALSCFLPQARVEAWDVSEKALVVARENNEKVGTRVGFLHRDVWADFPLQATYDVIVSNPPYIAEKEKIAMEPNVLDWEPDTALFVPDEDPLCFYRRIAGIGVQLLLPDGKLYFEINQAYGAQLVELLRVLGYKEVRLLKDLYGKDRIVSAVK